MVDKCFPSQVNDYQSTIERFPERFYSIISRILNSQNNIIKLIKIVD